jgi:hypothetical protein
VVAAPRPAAAVDAKDADADALAAAEEEEEEASSHCHSPAAEGATIVGGADATALAAWGTEMRPRESPAAAAALRRRLRRSPLL